MDEIFDIFQKKYNFEKRKVLGKGGFGVVREIKMKDKIYAAKLVKKDAKKDTEKGSINETEENNIILFLHNPNIVKIHKIYQETYYNPLTKEKEIYNLIIMEKANLKDLRSFIRYLYNHNSDIINNAFSEIIGDNFLRLFVKQIINGLEILERNELIHFDIKPENILIFIELSLKLSDFGLLREVYKKDKIRIPGGTPGYLSPDYFLNTKGIEYLLKMLKSKIILL
jgi:serine/threonine protein kinase